MELDLRGYVKIIKKRIWLLLAIVLFSSVASGVVSFFFLTPIYEASTKLIVNKPAEAVGQQLNINDVTFNIQVINTYKEVIKTHYIMGIVAAEYPQFGLTSSELIEKVKVSSVNNTQVMTLVAQDKDYVKAANIVNAVSKVFQREIPKVMKVDNVSILNEASVNVQPAPVKPNPVLNVAISFVVSMMAAVGLILLLEYLDDTIRTEADVEQYLGLPTLSAIMKIKDEDLAKSSRKTESIAKVGDKKHVNATTSN
ncbi:YveK family protein [Paenibacillus hemerocallicola]|uniref:YveK family protein n=1 Tax=Paenibacillus hemerocallicola TaxID=1172614 RepID=UPI00159ED154|nr:Wzz/FepE/Etk N-terminal domain-containing protein [Paenibacillus hemerocallicola]